MAEIFFDPQGHTEARRRLRRGSTGWRALKDAERKFAQKIRC